MHINPFASLLYLTFHHAERYFMARMAFSGNTDEIFGCSTREHTKRKRVSGTFISIIVDCLSIHSSRYGLQFLRVKDILYRVSNNKVHI